MLVAQVGTAFAAGTALLGASLIAVLALVVPDERRGRRLAAPGTPAERLAGPGVSAAQD